MKTFLKGAAAASALSIALLGQGCGHSNPAPAAPVITDVNGGLAGSGTTGSAFVIDGRNLGSLGSATAGYSVDFRDATSNAVVAPAAVNFGSSGWTSAFITGTVPAGLTASTTYKLTVTTPEGTSNAVNFLVVASTPFTPGSIAWSKDASNLPTAAQGFSTVIAKVGTRSYIYAAGGNTGTAAGGATAKNANLSAVSFTTLNDATGGLAGAWSATTSLPAARGFAAAVVATSFNSKVGGNGTVYVIGGLDASGAATSTVFVASLNADGTIPAAGAAGTWAAATTPLPQARFAHGAAIFHGRLYVVGGNDPTGTPSATVYSSVINSDGSLGAWTTSTSTTSLPVGIAYHQLLSVAGNLYVLGGTTSAVDPVSNVASTGAQNTSYYCAIDLQTGNLVAPVNTTGPAWATTANLSKGREKFTAAAAGASIVVTGGLYSGSPGSSDSTYTTRASDGSLSSFGGLTGSNTFSSACLYNPYNQSTALFVDVTGQPHILILGGADVGTGTLHADVCYQH